MNKSKQKNNYIELLVMFVLILAVEFLGLKYSIISILSIFLLTILTACIAVRYKELPALVVCTGSFLINSCVFGIFNGIVIFVSSVVVGISIGYCLRNKISLKHSIVVGGIAFIIVFLIFNYLYTKLYGVNVIQQAVINNTTNMIEANKDTIYNLSRNQGLDPETTYAEFFNKLNSFFVLIPAGLVIFSLIWSYAVILCTYFFVNKLKKNTSYIEPFSEFRLPQGMGIALLISLIIIWNKDLENITTDKITMIFINVIYIISFGFIIQGLALADFWLKKFGLQGVLRIIVYAIGGIVLLPFMIMLNIPFLLTFVGIMDYAVDFRKLQDKKG